MRQELTQAGSMARSTLRRTLQQFRASAAQSSRSKVATQLKTTKDGDNATRSPSMVARRPVSGIELKFKPIERYLLSLVLIIETEPSFCTNRRCCTKGKYKASSSR